MAISSGTSRTGASFFLTAICMLVLPAYAFAETETTVNGTEIDSALVDFYLESALQKPAAQATAEERATVIRELTDIYLLTTQPAALELAATQRFKSQIELQKRGTLAQAVAQDFVTKNQASDEEILAAYEIQIATAPTLQYKARHILVETQATATDLISQLDTGGDFQELAQEFSTGPSGPSGGDLPWFSPDQMVKPFSDAVAALEDGLYSSEPVQTQFGWHVILREDSRANEPPTLESVRDTIKQNVEQTKFQSYLERLRSDYENTE
jgi:peptidyl-prolyl cis-trans isomerase C